MHHEIRFIVESYTLFGMADGAVEILKLLLKHTQSLLETPLFIVRLYKSFLFITIRFNHITAPTNPKFADGLPYISCSKKAHKSA